MNKVMYFLSDIGLRKDVKEQLIQIVLMTTVFSGMAMALAPLA